MYVCEYVCVCVHAYVCVCELQSVSVSVSLPDLGFDLLSITVMSLHDI